MDPQQPSSNPQQAPAAAEPQHTPASAPKVPFYRSYWPFAAIYLILPPIFGLIILLTGDIYRKQKDGHVAPISKREKITLTVVIIALWAFIVARRLSA